MMRLLLFICIGALILFSSCKKELFFDNMPRTDSTRLLPLAIVYNTVSSDSIKIEYDHLNRISALKKFYKDYLGTMHGDTITYSYDDNNRLIKATAPFGGAKYESVYSYQERTITETTTWLTHDPPDKSVTTFTINGDKHLIEMQGENGTTDYTYDSYGNQISSSFVNKSFTQSITVHFVYTTDSAMFRCVNMPLWFLESKSLFAPYIFQNISTFSRETVTEESGHKETYSETGKMVYDMNETLFPVLIHTTINGQDFTQKVTYALAK